MALAWLLAKAPDVVPIPGTRRVTYLEENTAAADLTLTPDEVATLDVIRVTGDREGASAREAKNWFDGLTPPLKA